MHRQTGSLIAAVLIMLALLTPRADSAEESPDTILLKDYRPRSVYNIPTTRVPRSKYPAMDMHSHPYAKGPEEIAQRVGIMDEVGIAKTIILTQATGSRFDKLCAEYAKHGDRFELWCGLDYTGYDEAGFGPAAVKELERCYRVGARGVGELGDKGKGLCYCQPQAWGMHLNDPRMDPLLDKCAELGMPVSIHVADPIWMYQKMDATNDGMMNAYKWRLDNQPGIIRHAGMIDILERAVKRHPKTTFIACHFANCSHDLSQLGRLLDSYSNLYADISARFAETAPIPRFAAAFYEKYQDRLLYGTDMGFDKKMYRVTFRILESSDEHFYEVDLFGYHWSLHGLGLHDEVLRKVYRENALRIMTRAVVDRK